jgi:hypothetical protein
MAQPATVQATQAAWAKLPSKEVGCINDALHQRWQRGSVDSNGRVAIRPEARQRALWPAPGLDDTRLS